MPDHRQVNIFWLSGIIAKLFVRPPPLISAWKALPDDLSDLLSLGHKFRVEMPKVLHNRIHKLRSETDASS